MFYYIFRIIVCISLYRYTLIISLTEYNTYLKSYLIYNPYILLRYANRKCGSVCFNQIEIIYNREYRWSVHAIVSYSWKFIFPLPLPTLRVILFIIVPTLCILKSIQVGPISKLIKLKNGNNKSDMKKV